MMASRIADRMLRPKPPSSIPGVSFPWLRPRRRLSFAPDRIPARPSRTELVKVARLSRAREGLTFTSSSTMASLERRVEIPVYGRIGHDQQPVPIAVPSQAARVVIAIGSCNRLAVRVIIGQASRTETRMGGDAPFARLRGAPSAP